MKCKFLHSLLVDRPSWGRVLLLLLPVAVWFLLDVSPVFTNFSSLTSKNFDPSHETESLGSLEQQGQHRLGENDLPGGHADLAYNHSRARESTARRNEVATRSIACNYAKGKWVADVKGPLYSGKQCRQWLSPMWSCRRMERKDFSYEGYRWQPNDCEMPEFSGPDFLQRMRNKTLAFVGDSLGREQFQSMMCIATGGKHSPEVEDVGWKYGIVKASNPFLPGGSAYRFPGTNTTILFYWSPTLSQLEPLTNSNSSAETSYALHLDRPADFLKTHLHSFDALVLNTGHHWNTVKFRRNHWKLYQHGKPLRKGTPAAKSFSHARDIKLHNIARWVDTEIVHRPRIKVFVRTMSPAHFVNGAWNTGGRCDNTVPLAGGSACRKCGEWDPA